MSQVLLQPTEPTPNACNMLLCGRPSENQSKARSVDFGVEAAPGGFQRITEYPPTGSLLAWLPGDATTNTTPRDESVWIEDLGEGDYCVRQPFFVRITKIGPGDFEASFPEANIAMSGIDSDDAYQALVAEILDTFDLLAGERVLIPAAAEQFRILREYIAKNQA